MLDKNTLIKVKNRNSGSVGYEVADLGVNRRFMPNEEKEIEFEELRRLTFTPGGEYILNHYLCIEDNDAVEQLLGSVEPEYSYSEADVRKLLLEGSIDELKDCLDFAPTGVVDMVKKIAVELKLNDIQKREAIEEVTGFSVTKAVEINKETEDENHTTKKDRRVTETKEKVKERRTESKYTE